MLIHHVPQAVQLLFPQFVWHKSRLEKSIYLTFDDGPVPGVTDYVLDHLDKRQMKATFFMVGDNVVKHPDLALKVKQAGHQIGNHTHNHLDGYNCSNERYLWNFEKCQTVLQKNLGIDTKLFRAPYGRIRRRQQMVVSKTHQMVMWDVIPGDFEKGTSAKKCLNKARKHTRNGSIILFHDQQKTEKILSEILPDFLDYIQEEGYQTALL